MQRCRHLSGNVLLRVEAEDEYPAVKDMGGFPSLPGWTGEGESALAKPGCMVPL